MSDNVFSFGIRARLLTAAVLLVLLSVGSISSLMYFNFSNALIHKDQEKIDQATKVSGVQLNIAFMGFERDILHLSNMPPVTGLIRALQHNGIDPRDGSTTDMWRARLDILLAEILQSNAIYGDARLIDVENANVELAKSVKNSSYPLTTLGQLRAVDDASCLFSAKKIALGETFIAEPRINDESGKNDKEHRLVSCISTPIFNDDGRLSAVLIVDLHWNEIYRALSLGNNDRRAFYLANDAGAVLLYPERERKVFDQYGAVGFLQGKLPALHQYLLSDSKDDQSLLITDVAGRELLVGIQRISVNQNERQFLLHLIAASPYEAILSAALITDTPAVIGIVLITLLTLTFTILVARSLTKPIGLILHALDAYEPGKPAPYLPLKRNDEIGELARAFREVMRSGEEYRLEIAQRIAERVAMQSGLQRLSAAVEQSVEGIMIIDTKGVIEYANHQVEAMFGFASDVSVGKHYAHVGWTGMEKETYRLLNESMKRGGAWRGDIVMKARDGTNLHLHVSTSPIVEDNGKVTGFALITRDISKRVKMELDHRAMEQQLNQAQKLESVGRLAAGIAHEINTPVQYISDNVVFLQSAFDKVLSVLSSGEEILQIAQEGAVPPELVEAMGAAYKKAKVDFLLKQVPPAFNESLEGLNRVAKIVGAMKEFSHPAQDKTLVDLNRAIESTITVASNEWKYIADLKTNFSLSLPPVTCLPGEFNQVILNIIVNAAHAIGELVGEDAAQGKGTITIETAEIGRWAEVRISDTGPGMGEEVKSHIFDAFFTTKEVGRGTGQGLSMAYNVIVEKHGGTIDVDSVLGQGTTFRIRLPLEEVAPKDTEAEV